MTYSCLCCRYWLYTPMHSWGCNFRYDEPDKPWVKRAREFLRQRDQAQETAVSADTSAPRGGALEGRASIVEGIKVISGASAASLPTEGCERGYSIPRTGPNRPIEGRSVPQNEFQSFMDDMRLRERDPLDLGTRPIFARASTDLPIVCDVSKSALKSGPNGRVVSLTLWWESADCSALPS